MSHPFQGQIPMLEPTRIETIGLSFSCPTGCAHCCLDLKPRGYRMPFSKVGRLFSSGDLKFDEVLKITYGEPFYYQDRGADLSHVAELILNSKKGISKVLVNSAGFKPGDKLPQRAAERMASFHPNVSCALSFNLFQGDEAKYIEKMNHTLDVLMQARIEVYTIIVSYTRRNSDKTEELLAGFLAQHWDSGLSKKVRIDRYPASGAGRGKNLPGREPELMRPVWLCRMAIPNDKLERSLTILPNGDVVPCNSIQGAPLPPMANAFRHDWETIRARYGAYLEQFRAHQESKPFSVSRCVWHRSMVFRLPQPRPEHLRHPARTPALARA